MRTTLMSAVVVALVTLLASCGDRSAAPGENGGGTQAVPPLTCPARWEGTGQHWVPRPAPASLDSRLVPEQEPVQAVLCRYDGSNVKSFEGTRLTAHRTPSAPALARALEGLRRLSGKDPEKQMVCTLMAGPQRNYLLGTAYPNGDVVWVFGADDPNSCVPTSNGRFTTQQSSKRIFSALASATR